MGMKACRSCSGQRGKSNRLAIHRHAAVAGRLNLEPDVTRCILSLASLATKQKSDWDSKLRDNFLENRTIRLWRFRRYPGRRLAGRHEPPAALTSLDELRPHLRRPDLRQHETGV